MLSKIVHIGVDLVLVSTALAGIRRATGLAPKLEDPNSTAQTAIRKYLQVGEQVVDYSIAQMANSKYFKHA